MPQHHAIMNNQVHYTTVSTTPNTKPPTIAPGIIPIPPNTAATNALIPGIPPLMVQYFV